MSDAWRRCADLDGHPAAPMTWAPAAPPGDLPALRRWRAAVGPARVGNGAARGTMRWPLTVAVWNANVGGGAIRAMWDHIARAREHAVRPAVLLLQEVFGFGPAIPTHAATAAWARRIAGTPAGEHRTDICSFARGAGLSLVYVPSMRNGNPVADPPEDRGNAILANVPLLSPTAIELPFERQRRVAVTAALTIGNQTVELCSVHLDNRAPWLRAWRTLGSARRRQMAALLGEFPGSGAGVAKVLGGDFNTWVGGRREKAYRLARARFPLPARPESRPTHHFEIGGWLRHSDHLMLRLPPGWNFEYRRLDDTFGSDHYPLVGTLEPVPEPNDVQ